MLRFKSILLAFLVLAGLSTSAQEFIRKPAGQKLTLPEIQRQFSDWAKTHDLKKTKGWKSFKRWEMDMSLKTDGRGQLADPAIYINAAVEAAKEREQASESKFSSAAWYPVGPSAVPNNLTGYMENGIGRINCIAFHPTNTSTYFVGVAQGGVWKTTNSGQSWTPLTDKLPITRISDIAIDPTNPNNMYISVCDFEYIGAGLYLDGRKRNTHYGLGVYKTTNGGQSWTPTGLSFQLTNGDASLIRKIIVNPSNNNKLVACGVSGMYTSSNKGQTWTRTMDSLFWDMVPHPTNPSILYAATGWVRTANKGNAAIYKSLDFGQTWTKMNANIPATGTVQRIKLAIAKSDPNYVYALAVNTSSGLHGIYKTINGGTSWQFINPNANVLDWDEGSSNGGQGNYDLAFIVNAQNKNKLYVGGINVWGSSDGGVTFEPASHWTSQYGPTLHGDIHFIEQQKGTNKLFVCSDGGIYRTNNIITSSWADIQNGATWQTQWSKISNGLAVTSFYRLSSSRNTSGRLVAGAQDNASFFFDGTAWSTIFGGDGMDNYLDPVNDDNVIGSSQYGSFYLSNDAGVSSNWCNANVNNESGEWTSPIVADYTNYGTLYAGFENVTKSTDGGNSWNSLGNLPNNQGNQVSALAVSSSNPDVIYAGKRVRHENGVPGSLYVTQNGGNSWTNITGNLPDSLYFTSLEVKNNNAAVAYVTMAGFSAGQKVYRTSNSGTSWSNISYNLPNIPVNCIKNIPNSNDLMVATDIGVYMLASGTTTWLSMNVGLPNVIVSDIEFNQALNKIYVSTFGRGIWATDLATFVTANAPELSTNTGIELFPSPNNGSFTISFGSEENALLFNQLEVIDITGRTVHKAALSNSVSHSVKLEVPSGMYFARITGKAGSSVKSFVVE